MAGWHQGVSACTGKTPGSPFHLGRAPPPVYVTSPAAAGCDSHAPPRPPILHHSWPNPCLAIPSTHTPLPCALSPWSPPASPVALPGPYKQGCTPSFDCLPAPICGLKIKSRTRLGLCVCAQLCSCSAMHSMSYDRRFTCALLWLPCHCAEYLEANFYSCMAFGVPINS